MTTLTQPFCQTELERTHSICTELGEGFVDITHYVGRLLIAGQLLVRPVPDSDTLQIVDIQRRPRQKPQATITTIDRAQKSGAEGYPIVAVRQSCELVNGLLILPPVTGEESKMPSLPEAEAQEFAWMVANGLASLLRAEIALQDAR